MHAFILAGGFATRLWPLTEKRAKPLLPLAGKPILTHLVERIPAHIPVTVSTNAAFAEGFERWLTRAGRPGVALVVEQSRKDEQKVGALGATAEWIERHGIADDVLLLTGDNYLGFSIATFLGAFTEGRPLLAAHDIGDREKARAFGTVILRAKGGAPVPGAEEKGAPVPGAGRAPGAGSVREVEAFEEKPSTPRTSLVSTGCSVIPRELLPVLTAFAREHPDNVGGVFEEFLRRGIAVDCFTFSEPWLDVGSFDSYLDAHRLLLGGITQTDPRASLSASVCQGSVAIGAGSRVERSELTDCMIFEGCRISDCVLENCIVDDRCVLVGIDLANKMLREGTVLDVASGGGH